MPFSGVVRWDVSSTPRLCGLHVARQLFHPLFSTTIAYHMYDEASFANVHFVAIRVSRLVSAITRRCLAHTQSPCLKRQCCTPTTRRPGTRPDCCVCDLGSLPLSSQFSRRPLLQVPQVSLQHARSMNALIIPGFHRHRHQIAVP